MLDVLVNGHIESLMLVYIHAAVFQDPERSSWPVCVRILFLHWTVGQARCDGPGPGDTTAEEPGTETSLEPFAAPCRLPTKAVDAALESFVRNCVH